VRINPDVCPTLADHVFPKMRAAGLLASNNTDDPALVGLDLGIAYAEVAAAYGYGWDEMVAIALDAVTSSWASADEQAELRAQILAAAQALAPVAADVRG
jgi:adenosine deaminase